MLEIQSCLKELVNFKNSQCMIFLLFLDVTTFLEITFVFITNTVELQNKVTILKSLVILKQTITK